MRKSALSMAVFFAAAMVMTNAAQATEKMPRVWPSASLKVQHVLPPCTCRASGRDYRIGESICLNARRAICGMDLNVTSWSLTNEGCEMSAYRAGPAL